MRTTAFGVVAAATSVLMLAALLLAGFGPYRDAPTGPSETQIETAVRAKLDRQWQLSGLEGIVPRPRFVPAPIVTERQWGGLMTTCMRRAGVDRWGYDAGSGLFIEGSGFTKGATLTSSDQLAFYWCFADYPMVDLVSKSQLNFIYDYYARWLIPCLERRGYNVTNAPSREVFVGSESTTGLWNPYRALERYPATPTDRKALSGECAPTIAGIAGWSER